MHSGVHGGSGTDFPSLSRQRPFFYIQTWISSQLLQECGCDPSKATLELLPCISPRYILTHPRGCFQGDDSELSPPGTEPGTIPHPPLRPPWFLAVPGASAHRPAGSAGNPVGKSSPGLRLTSGQCFTRGVSMRVPRRVWVMVWWWGTAGPSS